MNGRPTTRARHVTVLMVAGILSASTPARADVPPPPAVRGIDVVEHLGERVPRNLRFTDTSGKAVTLGDFIDGKRPIVLVLAYVKCQSLCSLVLRGVANAARQATAELGHDYRIVTVDIDPTETPRETSGPLRMLVDLAGGNTARPAREWGWSFLTGDEAEIRELARRVGFEYRYDERTKQYAHPAVVMTLSPAGRVMRYLYGARYEADVFDAAIAAAARSDATPSGGVGGSSLGCFHFDPSKRAHWAAITRFYAIGGAVLTLFVGGLVVLLLRRERRLRC